MHSEVTEGFMLSPQQKSLWSQQQQGQDYRATGAVLIEGDLRNDLLESAVGSVISRHEILRTTFHLHPGMTFPFQVIAEEGAPPLWDESDLDGLSFKEQEGIVADVFAAAGAHHFDLQGGPLVRASVLRLSTRRHVLILSLSPLCADAATLDNLFAEIAAIYAALAEGGALPAEQIQYADFAVWQHEMTEGEDAEAGLAYWRGVEFQPLLAQPVPFERHSSDEFPASLFDSVPFELEPSRAAALETTARQYDVSVGSFLLACWQSLVWRLTGQQDIVVGLDCDGRKYEEVRGACGLYAKQLPLAVHFKQHARFSDVLAQVKRASEEAREWEEYFSCEAVIAGSPPSLFFPLGFEFYEPPVPFAAAGLSWIHYRRDVCTNGLKLKLRCATTTAGGLRLAFDFDPRYVTRDSAQRLAAHFGELLSSAAARPTARVAELELLDEDARRMILVNFNRTAAEFGPARCFHETFEEQARLTPERVAVVCEDGELTYAELSRKSNQLARYLRARGVGRETLVGLFGEREVALMVGMLGVLKAGAAYVALDPKYPKERLAGLVEDAQPKLVLTKARFVGQLPACAEAVCLDADWPQIALESEENCESNATPDNLAYVIYTSGSTGKPKGVTIEHRQLFNYLSAIRKRIDFPAQAAYATVSTLAADLGHTMIYPALASGGTLHVVSHDWASDPQALAEYFTRHKIDCLKIVPSHLQALLSYAHAAQLLPAERLVLGGEATRWELLEQLNALQPSCRIFNHYGPTETTVGVITCEVEGARRVAGAATLPLGRPLANTRIYLLDAKLDPVPVGVAGDLYIGGDGLARGYLRHPGLTAEKFIPDPFAHEPGLRLYDTGDRARYLPDGQIEFLGRADHQVKFHGFRVELNEIRSELNQHPQVSDSIVVIGKGKSGGEMLIAYYVSRQEIAKSELRGFLAANIIEETLPNAFVHLSKFPLTLNGKLNYAALPTVEQAQQNAKLALVAPRTPVEQILASIWADVLGVERLSIHDNFFELGGHSLLATQVISRLREAFSIELPLRDLFETPTVAGLAARVEDARQAGHSVAAPPITAVPRDRPLPLSFAQQRLWFTDQMEPGNPAYNMFGALRLSGQLDADALEQSVNQIVARHESLRTTFGILDDEPVQHIAESLHVPLPMSDLSALCADEREAVVRQLSHEESGHPFDLVAGPLLRLSLLRLREDEHVLFVTMHHIIGDAWSIAVFTLELASFYETAVTGRAGALPLLPIQYADFAHWQRQWLQGENLERELSFWKERLEGAPPVLELPTDRPRPEVQSFRGARRRQLLPSELLGGLKALGRSEGVTLFMTLLAVFQVLLHRYTGQDDIVVGTDIANRNRQETENLIGFFVNHPVLRTNLEGNPDFREVLARVREVTLDAYAHQDLPFDKLVSALRPDRHLSHMPIFQVLLVLRNTPIEPLQLSGLTLSLMEVENRTSKFDVALFLEETPDGLAGVWNFSTDLFDDSTIERIAGHFEQLLNAAVARPDARIDEIDISGLGSLAAEDAAGAVARQVRAKPTLTAAAYAAPQNPVEEALAAIWSQILGVEKIGVADNFFELGGDSIMSIQIIARASRQGIRLTPKQFFQHQTISALAAVAGSAPVVQAEQGRVAGPVPLTPIQQMFFARELPEPNLFTQAVLLETDRHLDPVVLEETVRRLLHHHDALRLHYERGEGVLRQQVCSGDVGEIPFSKLDFSALPDSELDAAVAAACEVSQSSINLSSGALLKLTHFEQGAGRPNLVLLTVHHLAVDVVSWRILIEDFQSLYEQLASGDQPQLPEKTTSFKHWAERSREHVNAGEFRTDARYWLDQLQARTRSLPRDFDSGANTLSSARVVTSTLGADETRALLQEVPQAYQTHVNDALLTALAQAFDGWSGFGSHLVELEGHGREEVFDDVDLSRTVGWFTSLYPVLLECEKNAGPGDTLKRVKEKLRNLPSRGLSFGLLRCCGTDAEAELLREIPRPEVSFNYLGQFELENKEFSSFGKVRSSRGASARMIGERTHLLEVDAKVMCGQLQVDWTYSENIHRRETVEALAKHFEKALRAVVEHCQLPEAGGFTPSDFPDAELSQAGLDSLFDSVNF